METLSVPSTLEHLPKINEFISTTVPTPFTSILPQVELAAEELLVNIFSYAYPDATGFAEVGCHVINFDNEPTFCLTVRDWGTPFDPFFEVPTPDTSLDEEKRPIGGLGVYLIKSIVRHYSYSRSDGTNTIKKNQTLTANPTAENAQSPRLAYISPTIRRCFWLLVRFSAWVTPYTHYRMQITGKNKGHR